MTELPFRKPPDFATGEVLFECGGPIDEASITLGIYGDDLDPDEITRLLKVRPTNACRKGDIFRGKRYDRIEKQGRWLYGKPHSSRDIDEQIQCLLSELPGAGATWTELTARFKLKISLGLWLYAWNRGFDLSAETLRMLADRRVPIGFDVYCDLESETNPTEDA